MKTRDNTVSLPYFVLSQYSVIINKNGRLHSSRVNRHDVLRAAGGDGRRALRMYQERFPIRNHPHHTMFARLYQRLREAGYLRPRCIGGRPRQTRTPGFEEEVLERVGNDPHLAHMPLPMPWVQISLQYCESCKNKTPMHTASRKYKDWGLTTSHLVFDLSSGFCNGAS